MGRAEQGISFESKEKLGPSEAFLLGEPIVKRPRVNNYSQDCLTKLTVPKGSEKWALQVIGRRYSESAEAAVCAEEYWDIAQTLKRNGVDFKFILAHPDLTDPTLEAGMRRFLGVGAFKWFNVTPPALTAFPRDILFDFDGQTAINPEANMIAGRNSVKISCMGEGGLVLKVGKKVFTPTPKHYKRD